MVYTKYRKENVAVNRPIRFIRQGLLTHERSLSPHGGKRKRQLDRTKLPIQGGGGESGEQPSLNNSLQLRQGQKTMRLLTGAGIEGVGRGFGMLKSHESMVENYWELCRMIAHVVNKYYTLDVDLRLLHNS